MAELVRSEQEQEAIAIFLREVNKDRSENGLSPVGTSTALLFLTARKFDTERAVNLYRQYQHERHLYFLQEIAPYDEPLRSELLSGKFTILNARDAGGAAVAVFTARQHFPAATTHRTVIQGIAFQLDECLKSDETQKNGLILLYDMTESGYHNFDYGLARKILDLLKGGYPARLKNVFIISPPLWFKAFLTLLTSFLQQKLRDRIEIVPRESLVQRLPQASVPESLGGMLKVDHFAWLNTCLMSFSESMKENGVVNARQGNRDLIYTESSTTGVDAGVTDEGALSVMEFMEHLMKLTPKGIKNEFVDLKRRSGNGNFYSAKLPENKMKNRYLDVLCLEESRVKLNDLDGNTKSNYIHANYMDGYKQPKAYIATQGPLPNTKSDFWQMLWEQQVYVIVMVTRCLERSRMKCIQYWPENSETNQFETVDVAHQETLEFEDHVERTFSLRHKKSGETRRITHFQMTSWPDYGVPSSAESCLHVIGLVREAQTDAVQALGSTWKGHPRGPPILVHCSAGIGRTGTFCTIDVNVARLSDVGKCEIFNTVKHFRAQRALTIQTVEQYEFCHLAILEHALNMPSTMQEEKEAIRDFLEGWKMQLRDSTD
ncbi:unnamed protein product [Porites evermanni]|uniref:Tyrosine-protein phosphatase non-receptor type 9 n=1 Tax=Porites evermanni TaxID=104178 RepID=A0ABN8LMW4_9CNID|nr:unnamed protein product [Porites evermanni]